MAQPEAWHVARTMRALELLAFTPLSAPQLAAALQAHPRTVRRLLARLEEEEYVRCGDGARRIYEPTFRLVALASQIVEGSSLARTSRPYAALLREQVGATTHLCVPSYRSVLCLVHCGADDAASAPRLREVVPAHCSAAGKALLAWRDRWRESVLSTPLERRTERTLVDTAGLRRQLDQVRERGYATEDGELEAGVSAVAAIVMIAGEAVGAIGASGPELDVEAAAPRVMALAQQIGEELERGAV